MFVMFGPYIVPSNFIDIVLCTQVNNKWVSMLFLKDNTCFQIEAKSKRNAVQLNERFLKNIVDMK